MISLVIPTYNEAEVIEQTLRRAAQALRNAGERFELIVVDDASADGTAALAERLAPGLPVRVLKRAGRLGLATAVVAGWKQARGDVLGVMDADLQHPPEVLATLARALAQPGVDLAVATRYAAGGGTSRWPWRRHLVSRAATHLVGSVLPGTLGALSDPMSGMFLVRASALEGVELDPTGYKIFLEVLAKANCHGLAEVPYVFDPRGRGSSKLGAAQYLEGLAHLARLARSTGQLRAWIRYGAVGLVGGALDVALTCALVERFHWRLALALLAAIELALLSNFFANHYLNFRRPAFRRLTFPRPGAERQIEPSLGARLVRYQKACAVGAVLNLVVTLGVASRGAAVAVAAGLGVLAGGLLNFLFNIPAIWRVWGQNGAVGAPAGGPAAPSWRASG